MNPPHVVEIKALIRKNMHTEKLVNQWIKAKNSFRGKGGKQKLESTNQIGYQKAIERKRKIKSRIKIETQ